MATYGGQFTLTDNAMAESINGLYKAEVIHRKSWKNRAEVELATLTWVLLAVQIAAGVLAFVVMIVLSRHPLVVEVKRQFCRSEKMKMLLRAG